MKVEKSHLKILNELYIIETNGAGGGGASIPRKVLTCRKSGQNPWKSGKIPENLGKMAPKIPAKMATKVVWLQKMAPKVSRKTHEDLFFGAHTKKGLRDHCWWIFVGNSRTNKFGEIRTKIPRTLLSWYPIQILEQILSHLDSLTTGSLIISQQRKTTLVGPI